MFWARPLSFLCFIIFQFVFVFFFQKKFSLMGTRGLITSTNYIFVLGSRDLQLLPNPTKKMVYLITRFTGRLLGCLLKSCRKKAISGLKSELIIPISYTRSPLSCLKLANVEFSFSIRSYKF